MSEISRRFADIRIIKKLNRRQFADSLGINQSVAGDIELGKREPSRDVLMKLAMNYKVNINWLFTGDGARLSINASNKYGSSSLKSHASLRANFF